MSMHDLADDAVARCRLLSRLSETPAGLTRTFLSPPMNDCHRVISGWMDTLGMKVTVDAIGNLRGVYPGNGARRLLIGSHIDTVPNAGAFDGVLGVMIGLALVEDLAGRRLPFEIEVIAFSEEEGVRFQKPFLGSLALTGNLDIEGGPMVQAIRDFGLDPDRLGEAKIDPALVIGYLEFHIEQGPVLDNANLPLAVVEAIAGQSRWGLTFQGAANHAGTTPMDLRHDALAAAAEWIVEVEREALATDGLVATVGSIEAIPNAGNVIAGEVRVSLDVRHRADSARHSAVQRLLTKATEIGRRRGVAVTWTERLIQSAVQMDEALVALAKRHVPFKMVSGAGHDAMILAAVVPAVMLFLRSPGGISHHPDETVRREDVAAAIQAGAKILSEIAQRYN